LSNILENYTKVVRVICCSVLRKAHVTDDSFLNVQEYLHSTNNHNHLKYYIPLKLKKKISIIKGKKCCIWYLIMTSYTSWPSVYLMVILVILLEMSPRPLIDIGHILRSWDTKLYSTINCWHYILFFYLSTWLFCFTNSHFHRYLLVYT
jgi:hypothetical protein